MKSDLPHVALAATLLFSGAQALAYSNGSTIREPAYCSACHTGGRAPQVTFGASRPEALQGNRLLVAAGQRMTLVLHIDTAPGGGAGFAVRVPAGVDIRPGNTQSRLNGEVLAQSQVIAASTGRHEIPLTVLAPPDTCGKVFPMRFFAAGVNRNHAPAGDGAAQADLTIAVACESPKVGEPVATKAPEHRTFAGATLDRSVTLTPNIRQLSDMAQISTDAGSGATTLSFAQSRKRVVVDCVWRGAARVRFDIEQGGTTFSATVESVQGHAAAVVPGAAGSGVVSVRVAGEGGGSFESCSLTPVP